MITTPLKFAICIVTPSGYVHSHAFDEVAETINFAIQQLGFESTITNNWDNPECQYIILGTNLLPSIQAPPLPTNSILLNLEQLEDNPFWLTPELLQLFSQYTVADYNIDNIKFLRTHGIEALYFPIGYEPCLTRIRPCHKDVDVLFYGSYNERREIILRRLSETGLNIQCLFGVYGDERDAWIARSKIILNMHFYPAKLFEIVRVSYLLANRQFVISETDSLTKENSLWSSGLVFSAYETLVDTCTYYAAHPNERQTIADKGFELFSRQKQHELIKPLFQQLGWIN